MSFFLLAIDDTRYWLIWPIYVEIILSDLHCTLNTKYCAKLNGTTSVYLGMPDKLSKIKTFFFFLQFVNY